MKRCLPFALDWREDGGDVRPFRAGPLGPAPGIGGRCCSPGVGVAGAPVVPVHILMEDDSPRRGRRRAAAATGSARVPCLLALFRRAALHPQGVGTARAPLWGERLQGAAVCARGGTPPGWWTPRAFRGVSACRLPWRLRDVLGPRPPVA